MKNFKKTLALLAALALSATALYGCGETKEDSKPSSSSFGMDDGYFDALDDIFASRS